VMVSSILPTTDGERDLLVHAYLDGELDAVGSLAVKQMIDTNPALTNTVDETVALQRSLRREFPNEPIPAYLKSRIDAVVGASKRSLRPTWMLMAASVVAAMAISSTSTWLVLRTPATNIMMAELVDGHMRSLAAPQSTDIASSDRHTVKPWFTSKLPQSPKVVDLASEGFPLVGARIDVFGKTPVPTLVYGRRRHLISLTAVSSSDSAPSLHPPRPVNGFNIVSWIVGETTYWALSDLNATELNQFAKLFQAS
jgi:anti-sigma factor RsiW